MLVAVAPPSGKDWLGAVNFNQFSAMSMHSRVADGLLTLTLLKIACTVTGGVQKNPENSRC